MRVPVPALALALAALLLLALPTFGRAEDTTRDFAAGQAAYDAGDYETAHAIWLPLAEAGDPKAQYWIGDLYRFATGVEQDFPTAIAWMKKAARQTGDPDILRRAVYALGYMVEDGSGTKQDKDKAECLVRVAAENGYPAAQFALYTILKKKPGINWESLDWAERGAAQGDDRSLAVLGNIRVNAPFLKRAKRVQGYTFLLVAAEQNNERAKRLLAEARADTSTRTQGILREAEEQARQWKAVPEEPPSPPVTVPDECWP